MLSLMNWLCFFKYESLKFCFIVNDYESAKHQIERIYNTTDTDKIDFTFESQLEDFTNAQESTRKSPSYCEVLFKPDYRYATWLVMAIAFFNQFTGINLIGIYSTSIFEGLQADLTIGTEDVTISPIVGSALVGVA